MFNVLMEMFSYAFLVRAVIVGLLVSLCASLLGVSLVLKRYSMIGDGLSHVGFGSLAVATAMNAAPLTVSIPVVVLAAFLLLRISESSRIKGDAAIAIISTSSLAIGVVVISLTTGMNTDVCNYLFGSILAMSRSDVTLSVVLAIVVLTLFVLFYHKIFAVTFDETFAKATGTKTGLYNVLIAFLTAITIVLGMRMMGALLISSLIIFPALTSMRICKKFRTVTVCSAIVSVACYFVGVTISYLYATPTGASVVIINIAAFLLFWAINLIKSKTALRKLFAMTIVCLVLLTGCGDKTSASSSDLSGGGTAGSTEESGDGSGGSAAADDQADKGDDGDIIEIKEKMFIAQTNDIYVNPQDYLGKTLKYEGIFDPYVDEGTGETYYFVIRYGPGCCGYDANAGFEISWSGEYPKKNDWVEVVGVLEEFEDNGDKFLRLNVSSLKILDTRGAEYVYQ